MISSERTASLYLASTSTPPPPLDNSATLSDAIFALLKRPAPYKSLKHNVAEYVHLKSLLERVKKDFVGPDNEEMAYQLHRTLNTIYDYQINCSAAAAQFDPLLMEVMLELEATWMAFEKKRIPDVAFPQDPKDFAKWIKTYVLEHVSSNHPIYQRLADDCTFEEMSYFFSQEVTIDPRFDDLIALMQIGVRDPAIKLEIAGNFWDEMGNGTQEDVHSVMFAHLYEELDIFKHGETFLDVMNRASWPALACGNSLLYSVLHRKNFNLALGALGTVEIISPLRFSHLVKGFSRLGLSARAIKYHRTHISIEARHGNGWLNNAVIPTVSADPGARHEVFAGAMLRLNTSMDYCQHIKTKLSH